jgi:hypothetical protein
MPLLLMEVPLQRRLHQQGLDLSLSRMMELLGGLEEVLVIYPQRPGEKRPRTATCLSERDADQDHLMQILELGRYQPSEDR